MNGKFELTKEWVEVLIKAMLDKKSYLYSNANYIPSA